MQSISVFWKTSKFPFSVPLDKRSQWSQDLWGISANVSNIFGLFATHSFTNSRWCTMPSTWNGTNPRCMEWFQKAPSNANTVLWFSNKIYHLLNISTANTDNKSSHQRIHTLCCKCLGSFAFLWCKMSMFWRAGMREGGKPLPLAFQYLIFMV